MGRLTAAVLCLSGPGMELTLMVMPGRDLPVSEAVSAIRPAMLRTLESIEHDEGDTADVEVFLRMFNQRRMAGAPFLERDDKGNLMLKEVRRPCAPPGGGMPGKRLPRLPLVLTCSVRGACAFLIQVAGVQCRDCLDVAPIVSD